MTSKKLSFYVIKTICVLLNPYLTYHSDKFWFSIILFSSKSLTLFSYYNFIFWGRKEFITMRWLTTQENHNSPTDKPHYYIRPMSRDSPSFASGNFALFSSSFHDSLLNNGMSVFADGERRYLKGELKIVR